jgi:hypothetical protein
MAVRELHETLSRAVFFRVGAPVDLLYRRAVLNPDLEAILRRDETIAPPKTIPRSLQFWGFMKIPRTRRKKGLQVANRPNQEIE